MVFRSGAPGVAGWDWNWKNPELNEWFASRLVDFILLTGADGFRADCAPFSAGTAHTALPGNGC